MANQRKLHPSFHTPETHQIAGERGILHPGDNFFEVLLRVVSEVETQDLRLGGGEGCGFADRLLETLLTGAAIPSTQILAHAGKPNSGAVASCTVLKFEPESSPRRAEMWDAATRAFSEGMGIGFDFSEVDDPVREMATFNDALRVLDNTLVQNRSRPLAAMFTLDASHPRVSEFISHKVNVDFNLWRANTSVAFSEGDSDVLFEQLLPELAQSAFCCGEPGVLFLDRFHRDNATPELPYHSTAPCAEVGLSVGELCHFSSINLLEHVHCSISGPSLDWIGLQKTVSLLVRALDAIVEISVRDGAPNIVKDKRRIAVGLIAFHDAIDALGFSYDDPQTIRLANELSEWITYCAYAESARLAIERGPFPLFPTSRWADLRWLLRREADYTGRVCKNDWDRLLRQIATTGVRHATLVAYAPTGTVSRLLHASTSFEPVLTKFKGLQRAREKCVPPSAEVQLKVVKAFAKFADESCSKTVSLPQNVTVHDVAKVFRDARRLGLKGITVFRDRCLSERGNVSPSNVAQDSLPSMR